MYTYSLSFNKLDPVDVKNTDQVQRIEWPYFIFVLCWRLIHKKLYQLSSLSLLSVFCTIFYKSVYFQWRFWLFYWTLGYSWTTEFLSTTKNLLAFHAKSSFMVWKGEFNSKWKRTFVRFLELKKGNFSRSIWKLSEQYLIQIS